MDIVKSFKQKKNGNFTEKINLSSNGSAVEMASGLNLEEEIHLGGRMNTSITTLENGITKIQEQYNDLYETNAFFNVITAIKEAENRTIILRVIKDANNIFVRGKLTFLTNDKNTNQNIINEKFCNADMATTLLNNWGVN